MIEYFVPTRNNNYKAAFLKNKALFLLAILIFAFNILIPINAQAQEQSKVISPENLLLKHNEKRKVDGLTSLVINRLLMLSAQNKANEMVRSNCWSHYCPDGRSPWEFLKDAEYDYIFAGENLGEGFYNVDTLMNAWMNSPTHRENVMRDKYTEIGFGVAYGNFQGNGNNIVVVVHFGTQNGSAVYSDDTKEIKITSPLTNQIISTLPVDLTGKAIGFDSINIFNNEGFVSNQSVHDGIFTYKLENIKDGKNVIEIEGLGTNGKNLTSSVDFMFDESNIKGATFAGFINLSPDQKKLVNLGFLLFFGLLFLLDFLIITRTQVIKKVKSYSHYHLGIIFILTIVLIVGGVAGNVGNGILN